MFVENLFKIHKVRKKEQCRKFREHIDFPGLNKTKFGKNLFGIDKVIYKRDGNKTVELKIMLKKKKIYVPLIV